MSGGQQTLTLPVPDPLGSVRRSDPATSWAAARKAVGNSRLRELILRCHLDHPDGLIDDELKRLLPEHNQGSITKRRLDLIVLHTKNGPVDIDLLEPTPILRDTRDETPAGVYQVTHAGISLARQMRLPQWTGARLSDPVEVGDRQTIERLLRTCQWCHQEQTSPAGVVRHLRQAHGCKPSTRRTT